MSKQGVNTEGLMNVDISNTFSAPPLPERSSTSPNTDAYSTPSLCQVVHPAKKFLTGYVQGNILPKKIADRLFLHQQTRTDYKQLQEKELLFDRIIPSLMSETGLSQTSVLTHLLSAMEITPYLRKINREEMAKVSDHPAKLQTTLVLELTARIKQGFKLHELCQLASEPAQVDIIVSDPNQTISIGQSHFTREDLGDETFRELHARLTASGKKKRKDPRVILADVQKRKAVSIAHWQNKLSMVLDIQDSTTRQCIANALNTGHELSLTTEAQCNTFISLIPTLTLKVHPGYLMLKPFSSWLSQHHLNGGKLSSQQLTWLSSMDTRKLYTGLTELEKIGLGKLCIYKEVLLSTDEAATPREQKAKKAIDDATPQQLTEVLKLFDKLLCDLTPSVNAENRLGIIYTMLKFTDQPLLETLLTTVNIGRQVFDRIYLTQLTLTYSLDEDTPSRIEEFTERSVNCLLKTLLLRMARCTVIMASKDELSVPSSVLHKALTLINHHNEGLQAVLSDNELNQPDLFNVDDWDDDSSDEDSDSSPREGPMRPINNTISAQHYLSIPDHLLTSNHALTLDPHGLILPKDKHFRLPCARVERTSGDRTEQRARCDEKKLREDFVLTCRSTDLTRPVDWIGMEVPITFLFKDTQDKSRLTSIYLVLKNTVLPVIQQAAREDALEEQQTMDVIRSLLALSASTGKPGLNIRTLITAIQERLSNQLLRTALQQLVTELPEQPCNRDRKLLLELCAFQLFAELHPLHRPFKRLIKILHIINSRSEHLRFGDDDYNHHGTSRTRQIKQSMADLVRNEWNQPDGLLGRRIRQSVKTAFKRCDGDCSYQQIMDSLLESMRPSNQPSDTYPNLIHRMSLAIEARMNERQELANLNQQWDILENHNSPTYQENLGNELECLIQSAARLCRQFLPEEQANSATQASSDTSSVDSDLTEPDQIHGNTLSPDNYLYGQLKALVVQIGAWVNGINDDCLISEDNANKAGIDRLEQFALGTTGEYSPRQNEDKITAEIIALQERFHCLQKQHCQWKSGLEIASTHDQWVETRNTLRELRKTDLLAPDKLQRKINKLIAGFESRKRSTEEQQLLSTVSALRNQHAETKLVTKALCHPNILEFNRSPERLSHRLTEINLAWSDHVRAQHHQYRSLENILYNLQNTLLYCAFEPERNSALNQARENHDHKMANLQSTQQQCESHPVQQLSYPCDQPLLSILDSMEQSHTAQCSGIDMKPLSEQQKQQLRTAIQCTAPDSSVSEGTSLFDWIGMGVSRQQRIAAASCPTPMYYYGTSTEQQAVELLRASKTHNARDIAKRQKQVDDANKTLAEMEASHTKKIKELNKYRKELHDLLKNRTHAEIMINGRTHSYADALIAFKQKNYYYRFNSVSSRQRKIAEELEDIELSSRRNRARHQRDEQWLQIAWQCQSQNIDPDMLPDVIELMELEKQKQVDDIDNKTANLQQQIQSVEKTITENSALIQADVAKLKASLKPELKAQAQQTKAAEQALFSKAFEHGHQLSQDRTMQRLLCRYLRENRDAASVRARITEDFAAQKQHTPPNYADIIEPPRQDSGWGSWSSPWNLAFHIINVPGAFPLLELLHKQGRDSAMQLLRHDVEGKQSSALVFAAAKGRYNACETLIKCLIKSQTKSEDKPDKPDNKKVEVSVPLRLDNFIQMLTANPTGDNRNLLHYVAQLAKPEIWKALLQLITIVSNKQDFDADYPEDCIENQVALDKEYMIKTLLTQTDCEGLSPADLLLFNIAKRIREWPETNEKALTSYCHDFLIKDAKTLWIIASESFSVEQLHGSIECFMKGIDNLDLLSLKKRQSAETFLKNLMRIFRVHGPAGRHEQLVELLTPATEEQTIFDSPPAKRQKKP